MPGIYLCEVNVAVWTGLPWVQKPHFEGFYYGLYGEGANSLPIDVQLWVDFGHDIV